MKYQMSLMTMSKSIPTKNRFKSQAYSYYQKGIIAINITKVQSLYLLENTNRNWCWKCIHFSISGPIHIHHIIFCKKNYYLNLFLHRVYFSILNVEPYIQNCFGDSTKLQISKIILYTWYMATGLINAIILQTKKSP